MQTLPSLTVELHYCLAEFLTHYDCAALSQTCRALRRIYKPMKWDHCVVTCLPQEKQSLVSSSMYRTIPLDILVMPWKFSWFPADLITTLEINLYYIHYSRLLLDSFESLDAYLKYEAAETYSLPPDFCFSKLKRLILNFGSPARNFLSMNKILVKIILSLDKVEIIIRDVSPWATHYITTELNVEIQKRVKDSTESFVVSRSDHNTPLHMYSKNVTDSTSWQKIFFYQRFGIDFFLRKFVNFPVNFKELYFSSENEQFGSVAHGLSVNVEYFQHFLPGVLPALEKCSVDFRGNSFFHVNPISDNALPVTIPIVTHLIYHESYISIFKMEALFKFPNLKFMSIKLNRHIFNDVTMLPDVQTASPKDRWNTPPILELVVSEKCTMHTLLYGILTYILISLKPKRLRVLLNPFWFSTKAFFQPTSYRLRQVLVNKKGFNAFRKEIKGLNSKTFGGIKKACSKEASNFFFNVTTKTFTTPFSLLEIEDRSTYFSQVGFKMEEISPIIAVECIFRVAKDSPSIEYIHFNCNVVRSRYFSPALNDLVTSNLSKPVGKKPSFFKNLISSAADQTGSVPTTHSLKQVLVSARFSEEDPMDSSWMNMLPIMEPSDVVWSYKSNKCRMGQACFGVNKPDDNLRKQHYNTGELLDPLWDSSDFENDDFLGWY